MCNDKRLHRVSWCQQHDAPIPRHGLLSSFWVIFVSLRLRMTRIRLMACICYLVVAVPLARTVPSLPSGELIAKW